MGENREIINADGRLVGTLEIIDRVLKKFRYAEGCDAISFSLTKEDLAGVQSIGRQAFWGCTSLESIVIPDSVTSIGNYAFWRCTSLESIVIPGSVTSIGNHAFAGCVSLRSIEIPDSVTSIGPYAFWRCTSLESIEIPGSVTSIDNCVFDGCTGLTEVVIPYGMTSIDEQAFRGCSSLQRVTLSTTSKSLGLRSTNIGSERARVLGLISNTVAYSIRQPAAFTLLMRSFKTTLSLKDTKVSLIETSKAAIDRARAFILCMLRQRDKGGLLSNVFKQQAVWCNPIIISSCINAEAITQSEYPVDRSNSTIGEGTTCHDKFRFSL